MSPEQMRLAGVGDGDPDLVKRLRNVRMPPSLESLMREFPRGSTLTLDGEAVVVEGWEFGDTLIVESRDEPIPHRLHVHASRFRS